MASNDKINQLLKHYEDLGKRWLADEVEIEEFGKYKLNDKQKAFVNSKSRELIISGGFRSGKTIALIIKMYLLCMFFPNNRLLLGRKTRSDLESATLPAVFDVFPEGTYKYRPGPGIIDFPNGSQILLYALDTAASGDDTKKSAQKIKGLDLGGAFIDQLEEVEYLMYEQLSPRLSRNVPFHQIASTTNPANFWAMDYFKLNPRPGTQCLETGMIDNKDNLPDGFIESQLTKPALWVRRFVYGEWTPDVLVDGAVFSSEYIDRQKLMVKQPIKVIDGLNIYEEPKIVDYQIGIDPSIGSTDPCAIVVVNKESGEVAATYSAFVPTNVITEKAVQLAMMYSLEKKPLIVPEATGIGQALVESLKLVYDNIYEREVFNQREQKNTKKLGFYTNYATKSQLVEATKELFHKGFPKLRDAKLVDELKTFVYTDEASEKGAGAQSGYHDDRIMAMMLAYWNIKPVTVREKSILDRLGKVKKGARIKYQYD